MQIEHPKPGEPLIAKEDVMLRASVRTFSGALVRPHSDWDSRKIHIYAELLIGDRIVERLQMFYAERRAASKRRSSCRCPKTRPTASPCASSQPTPRAATSESVLRNIPCSANGCHSKSHDDQVRKERVMPLWAMLSLSILKACRDTNPVRHYKYVYLCLV